MTRTISLEMNEVNFEFIRTYIKAGELPAFRSLLEEHGLIETVSEKAHPYLEPWIQWPTVYTGKTFAEHNIFRLGDAVEHEHVQIWDYLEDRGLQVGAISPMNAANRCKNPAFFLPDPWTDTAVTADASVAKLYECVKRLINDNASDRRSVIATAQELLPLSMRYLSLGSTSEYLRVLVRSIRHRWARAAILDRLLADLFLSLWKSTDVDYASLFLNAAAHIQHHHMYDSAVYTGDRCNPEWYSSAAAQHVDPLLLIYRTYDTVIRDLMSLKDTRLLITTGLSQYANDREHYQYRLVRPHETMARLGVVYTDLQPRMSRDFLLVFPDAAVASEAEAKLLETRCRGKEFFSVDNRGASLFCQVRYNGDPTGLGEAERLGQPEPMTDDVVLVSIENGLHRTTGYHVDTGLTAATANALPPQPLNSMFDKFAEVALSGAGRSSRALSA